MDPLSPRAARGAAFLNSERPEAYLAEDRQRALAAGTVLPDRADGSALFADISGFTALTEAFVEELGAQRGAERLADTLDLVFDRMLATLHAYGGSVVTFSGDAVTCWLDGDDGSHATACGSAMQQQLAEIGTIAMPSGRNVELAMKVAVVAGSARRFVVGDPALQLMDVLAGKLIDELIEAEQQAERGELIIGGSALAGAADLVDIRETRTDPATGREFFVVGGLRGQIALPPPASEQSVLPEAVVRQWLLPAVYERLAAGRGEFLTELRPAVPLFLRFGGIDYDDDPHAAVLLDEFVIAAQRIIDTFGGNALQLTIGDKGAYLYAVFGSPIAHEDDPARACAAAVQLMTLQDRDSGGAIGGMQIGISRGRLRSGTYGHATRRTFCCLGDAVNLAARLMSAAPPGGIYVADEVQAAAGEGYEWLPHDAMLLKGKAKPVAVFGLAGPRRDTSITSRRYSRRMVGRERELGLIEERIRLAAGGRGQVVAVTAEAGLGKSRLIAEAVDALVREGVEVVRGAAPTFGVTSSYQAWRDVWAALLDVQPEASVPDQQRHLEQTVAALDPMLAPRVPLLGAVLGLNLTDNDLTSALDAKLRKSSTEILAAQLLARLSRARGGLAIVVEDCSWLDPLSADLLAVLARTADTLPLVLLLAYRPMSSQDETAWHRQLIGQPHVTELTLAELDEDASRRVILDRYSQLFDAEAAAPEPLVELVLKRSEGNPFHIEELLNFVASKGIDPRDARQLAGLDVPDTLNSLVLSRVDVLAEAPRRTVKVASVIGRDFRLPMLRGTYPALGTVHDIAGHLVTLQADDLMLHEAEEAYLFRHAVIHEVAYDSLPFAIRETLHDNAGAYLEQQDGAGQQNLDLLAHHYWHSANEPKKREYQVLAADAAQAGYANGPAIEYYRRAVTLVPLQEKGPILLKLGKVLELVGDWAEADAVYHQAFDLAETGGDRAARARARTALAEVARKQGEYDAAATGLAEAEAEFDEIDDAAGLGQVLHFAGTLAAQQGDYPLARQRYLTSLAIRRRLGDAPNVASVVSNLAIIAEYEGDYAAARELNEQALKLRTATGDRWAIGISQNNLGMIASLQGDYAAARESLREAMRLHREVGDLWMVALEHDNLGNALLHLGELEQAGLEYAESLAGYRLFDEKWGLAILIEDVAGLAVVLGQHENALLLDGAASALREVLGSPRAPSQRETLDAVLAPAREALGADAGRWSERGGLLGTDEVLDLTAAVCRPAPIID